MLRRIAGWLRSTILHTCHENPALAVLLQLCKLRIHASTPLLVIVQPDFHRFVDAKEAVPFLEPRRQPVIHLGLKPRPQQSAKSVPQQSSHAAEGHGDHELSWYHWYLPHSWDPGCPLRGPTRSLGRSTSHLVQSGHPFGPAILRRRLGNMQYWQSAWLFSLKLVV